MGSRHDADLHCGKIVSHQASQQVEIAMVTVADTRTPAEIYDELLVPALFAQWGPIVVAAAGVGAGQQVLDVACGTGALTLAAAARVGRDGAVAGLDANPEMLAVARRRSAAIEWLEGRAEALPLPDASRDAVVSQFGLTFFNDQVTALCEMLRVLRPDGRLAVAVCDAFRAPFALGDAERLSGIARAAGIEAATVAQHRGAVRFGSIGALVATERACVWTLGGRLDDDQFARLQREAESALQPFVGADGKVMFEMPALILSARKPG
jgi:SAM-dependent methyltransferase